MLRRHHLVYALGVLFIVVGAGQSLVKVADGGPLLEALIDFVLIGFPGVLALYVGSWLSSSEIDPKLYPRIVAWSLAGVGVMFVFVVLRAVHPGVTTSFSFGTRAIALAIGSIAGLAIGIHESQAITRQQETERRNVELSRTRERLERRNEELTRTRAKLRDAVRRLESSNERLDHFASIVSHDLQEPLRMISQYLRLLEDRYADDLDEDAAEFVDFAVDGADRMGTMVDDLLRYSRIETTGEPLKSIDLDAVLEDVSTDLQVKVRESDAEIETESLPRVRGDASQLRQVFQNLLSNAIEYSGDGASPRIEISAERNGPEWVISVSDEGVGIDPDELDRIFEVFQRLHAPGNRAGSGIGLAVCKRIVERHDGEIWADSVPGEGSTFFFTVPATVARPDRTDATRR